MNDVLPFFLAWFGAFCMIFIRKEIRSPTYEQMFCAEYGKAEWWEPEPVFKMHYQVTLEDGRQVAVFRNMKTGSWYEAQP